MDDAHSLFLDETRASFFQLENLTSYLDMKAFGVVAINAILLSAFIGILIQLKANSYCYIPCIFLVISIGFVVLCVWPREHKGQSGLIKVTQYGQLKADNAAGILTANYVDWEERLRKIYNEKMDFLNVALALTIVSLGLIFVILIYLVSS